MELKINPQFEALIPPLAPEEFTQLETLLLTEGIRDALVIARYPDENGEEIQHLADGHNRYRIAQKHGLSFRTDVRDFAGEDDVVIWMIDNQKGRRNLTDFVKLELAEVKAERLRKKGRDKQKETLGGYKHEPSVLSIIDKTDDIPHNTRKVIAADLGWSTGKVAMGQKVMKEAPEEIKQQVRVGEISINQAYTALSKPHVLNNSGENEWYTPEKYIESARIVMGSIDLDPASSVKANEAVKAAKFYSLQDNGLLQKWAGNVWMNPPYSQPLISQFIEKLTKEEYAQAVVLVNNATETTWGQTLLKISSAVCFHAGRIRFVDPNGNLGQSPLQGQMICYIGNQAEKFIEEFKQYGPCLNVVK